MKSNAGTVSAYLDELPAERKRALETLRAMIEKAAPKAKGSMKYGLPSWEWNGPLFALASKPAGMGSPVSTHTACSPTVSRRGDVSSAPIVSRARTATPSIAAAS